MRIIWSEIAQATFVRFMADQDGMMTVNRAVEALADDPAPPGAFVRGAYHRLAAADAATLLDALLDYGPAGFDTELNGWLAGRDEANVVAQLLEAVPGTDPDLAGRRVAAIAVLTKVKPDHARAMLREMAANGSDGRSHVAAGVLANLGEELPLYRETTQQWLLIDLLTALRAGNLRQNLTQSTLEAIRSHADDLWRSDHPATADTIEATAAAMRDTDKALAKQLRRSAHKARTRS